MEPFKNIVVASKADYEDSTTLQAAASLAKRNDATVTVVGVVPELTWGRLTRKEVTVLQDALVKDVRLQLEEKVGPLVRGAGVQIVVKVLVGTPFVEIIRQVLREQHDLVMLTAKRKEGVRERLFGSTIKHLMRKCPCPTWVVKSGGGLPARVMAAVDTSMANETQNEVNQLVLGLASSVSRQEGADLTVIHCWSLEGESLLRGRRGLPAEQVDQWVEERRGSALVEFHRFVGRWDLDDLKVTRKLVKGDPGRVLPVVAKQENMDLLVMGTVARTGLAGALNGNTAEQVLQDVDCSVLAVKPAEFRTPIEP